MFITAAFTLSLSAEIDRFKYLPKNTSFDNTNYKEEFFDVKNIFYLKQNECISQNEKIKNHIIKIFKDLKISLDIYNNSSNLIDSIPSYLLNKIQYDNIYPSNYGTLIFDFEHSTDDLFSLEIGKDSIGYFMEVGGENVKSYDNLSLTQESLNETYKILISDLTSFES